MRLVVLTARPELGVNRRLAAAGTAEGVTVEVVDATKVTVTVGNAGSDLLFDGKSLLDDPPEAVLARIGNWRPETMLAMLEAVEGRAIWTPNPSEAFRVGRDHWRTVCCLDRAGLPVPKTVACMDPEEAASRAVSELGLPVVVKMRRSRMGVGVMVCRGRDHLEAVVDSLWRLGEEFLVQEWIECGGRSTRILVAGGDVVAAARFEAADGEWRSNGARGGRAFAETPDGGRVRLAVEAAAAVGLDLCGVDLLEGPRGPVVCEVNPTPGFTHLEKATGIDVAARFLRYAKKRSTGSGRAH